MLVRTTFTPLEGQGVVIGVVRLNEEDFVSGVAGDLDCEFYALAAGHVDDYLIYSNINAYLLVVLLYHIPAQLYETCGVCIGYVMEIDCLYGIQGAVRGLDVRCANVQVIHFYAGGLCGVGEWN